MEQTTYECLMAAALRFVSIRPRSRKEITDFLYKTLRRHHTSAPDIVSQVLDRLTQMGYANDSAFIAWWVHQRTQVTPRGTQAIFHELVAKGIPIEDAKEYFLCMPTDEYENATRILQKKMRIWKHLPSETRKRKIFGFLFRRGFSTMVIRSLVDGIPENRYNTSSEGE